jgi:protein-tyrosine phosphatase
MPRFLSQLFAGAKPNIFWVTPTLAVGGAELVATPRKLQKLGILAVLDMQAEADGRDAALSDIGVAYLKTPVVDFHAPDQRQIEDATDWVLEHMQSDRPVFIHCRLGLGRSVTMAIATLLRIGYDLPTAYNLVRKQRPEIHLSESQLAALRSFQTRLQS